MSRNLLCSYNLIHQCVSSKFQEVLEALQLFPWEGVKHQSEHCHVRMPKFNGLCCQGN